MIGTLRLTPDCKSRGGAGRQERERRLGHRHRPPAEVRQAGGRELAAAERSRTRRPRGADGIDDRVERTELATGRVQRAGHRVRDRRVGGQGQRAALGNPVQGVLAAGDRPGRPAELEELVDDPAVEGGPAGLARPIAVAIAQPSCSVGRIRTSLTATRRGRVTM